MVGQISQNYTPAFTRFSEGNHPVFCGDHQSLRGRHQGLPCVPGEMVFYFPFLFLFFPEQEQEFQGPLKVL